MAQAWPKAKPKLTQEAFDEAVASNIEDFDMARDEAIKSAIEEFNVQGYDLSSVVTEMAGSDLDSHPIAVACRGLKDALKDEGSLKEALAALSASLLPSCTDAPADEGAQASTSGAPAGAGLTQEASVIAHKGEAMQSLLEACRRLQGQEQPEELLQALRLLQRLLSWLETRDAFTDAKGVELIHELLKAEGSSGEVRVAAAAVAEAAARGVEEAKCRLVDSGTVAALLQLLQAPDAPLDLISASCGVLRSVTTADDERPPSSKAFVHARLLSKHHAAIRVLLQVLRRVPAAQEPATACRVLATVKTVAANEEICREFTDDGGVVACLQLLRECSGRRDVVRACLGALRQLAHSDTVKKLLAEAGAVPAVVAVVGEHEGAEDVAEAGLGLLGNMMLRQPEIAALGAEAGVPDLVLEAMQRHAARPAVPRQACLLIRIMVARSPELRPAYLERGAEALLRAAKAAHPNQCKDVGSAALRDLGLDNYND
ncbi:hypothetical protein HYH03_009744 [Edaphochlamys debaryana]|uniref:Armadillo repeat-containing protein 6 n=1 Tax=Edaphochlamys debaryana TaxID=47281 RepID=A0A835XY23_9CHLO|nr:hypothetical protein HYH03_009744 [Edaphochlamys debaryana]|eukprot:KAG2492015.1 hypothetical protein HYH03_009744 [Edaphochlamys debaryana]